MAKDSSSDHFDAIVSGAGAAGLTSAALLAKAGRKVLLVEKEARIGGYIRPLVSGPDEFDIGARLLMGCSPDGPFGPGDNLRASEKARRGGSVRVHPAAALRFHSPAGTDKERQHPPTPTASAAELMAGLASA